MQEAASLQSRLEKLQLPSVVGACERLLLALESLRGSCLAPSFAQAALEELCHLCQHVGRPQLPLLRPLPPLSLDEAPAQPAPAPAAGPLFPPETGLQAPRTMRSKAMAPQVADRSPRAHLLRAPGCGAGDGRPEPFGLCQLERHARGGQARRGLGALARSGF